MNRVLFLIFILMNASCIDKLVTKKNEAVSAKSSIKFNPKSFDDIGDFDTIKLDFLRTTLDSCKFILGSNISEKSTIFLSKEDLNRDYNIEVGEAGKYCFAISVLKSKTILYSNQSCNEKIGLKDIVQGANSLSIDLCKNSFGESHKKFEVESSEDYAT